MLWIGTRPARAQEPEESKIVIPSIEFGSEELHHLMWIHGTSLHVENPDRLFSSIRGFGTRISSSDVTGRIDWVHFAIPTPHIVSDKRLSIRSVFLNFKTVGTGRVDAVHVYNGPFLIAIHNNLNLSGEHFFAKFDVEGHPAVQSGIGVSVGVKFSLNNQTNAIDFRAAGAEFTFKTGVVIEPTSVSILKDDESSKVIKK
jgi:hypothetical protein